MANLYLMSGVPGSGKSTFLKDVKKNINCKIVSRDEIRFSIIKPDEDYFSHEDEVLNIFWKEINEGLKAGIDVYADQTSLTPKARKYFLNHVTGYTYVTIIWIKESLNTCLERNELRRGTRAYVPRAKLRRMYYQFIEPSIEEGFDYIFCYDGENNTKTIQKRGD